MLIRKLRSVLQSISIGLLLFAVCQPAIAQNQSAGAGKTAKQSKANADSCDGALDIVPVKAMTFTRKRRPSNSEPKPAEAKSEKQSVENKQSQ